MVSATLERPTATASHPAPPWESIAGVTKITEKTSTAKMLREAKLNGWNVHLVDLSDLVSGYKFLDETQVVVRKTPGRGANVVMGVVGSRYQPVQNEEIFAFGDALLKISSGTWEAAGSIKDGRVVFGVVDLGKTIKVGPDIIDLYLMVNSSHDGSLSLNVSTIPVRRANGSVFNLNLSQAEQSFKLRHTPSVSEATRAASEAVVAADHYAMRFGVLANKLYDKKITDRVFDNLVNQVYPKPNRDTRGAMSRWASKRQTIQAIWDGTAGETDTLTNVRWTAWGALCALIERVDYHRAPRLDNWDNLMISSSGFDAMTNSEKNRMADVIMKYAKV